MDCALRRHDSATCGVPVGLALTAPASRFVITDSPWPTPFERVPTSPGRTSGRPHEQRCLPPRIAACGSPWPTPQIHVPTSPGRSQWPTPCNWVPTSPDHGLLPACRLAFASQQLWELALLLPGRMILARLSPQSVDVATATLAICAPALRRHDSPDWGAPVGLCPPAARLRRMRSPRWASACEQPPSVRRWVTVGYAPLPRPTGVSQVPIRMPRHR